MRSKKIVFSDIDGTLSKGFVTAEFLRWLNKKHPELINEDGFLEHERLLDLYANKKIKYLDLVPKWSKSVAYSLRRKEEKKIKQKAKQFFNIWKKKSIYPSTYELVKLMKKNNYLFVLVTGGWEYFAELIAKEIGADDFVGMKIKENDGLFRHVFLNNVRTEQGKSIEIKKLIRKYKSRKDFCIGLGDSTQDLAIFRNAKKIVALNPNDELLRLARKNDWYISNHKEIIVFMQDCFSKNRI